MKRVIIVIIGFVIIGVGIWVVDPKEKKETRKEEIKPVISEKIIEPKIPSTPEPATTPVKEEPPQIELKLVETIKLPEGVKDVILDEESGRASIFLKEDSIQFLDDDMKVKKEYKLPCPLNKPDKKRCWTKVEFSKGNKYIGVNTIRKYIEEYVEEGEFVMLDKDGNELWKRKHNFFSITPSPNGEYFLGFADPECGGCPITIVHSDGTKAVMEATRYTHIDISDDGRYILNATTGYRGSESFVGLYEVSGNKIWKHTFSVNLTQGDGIEGRILSLQSIYVCHYQGRIGKDTSFLFDKGGNLIWKKEGFGIDKFEQIGNSLIGMNWNKKIREINIINYGNFPDKIVWETRMSIFPPKYIDENGFYFEPNLILSPSQRYIVVYVRYQEYTKILYSEIIFVDLINKGKIIGKLSNIGFPIKKIIFSKDESKLYIQDELENDIKVIKIDIKGGEK